ncbi:polysaccharide lyase family 1 protein [Periconia macrospinosa]|uniref:pectate lyase n=1 Tax=Periconia macrospinosa TaxID=97972 RepID=A0A2V1DBZ5_9PLEO|nr:polysaccharide lyase family 1 protein [Periconia macrospinosa]
MKFTALLPFGLATLALAVPTPTTNEAKRNTIVKRATLSDVPSTGYATQNGGTTGGRGGATTTVSSFAQFTAAVAGNNAKIVVVSGPITSTGNVKIGSNTSIIGKDSSAVLTGFTLTVKDVKNVIIRNIAVKKVIGGDAIAVQVASNVWIDHVDLSADMDHDKDYYDGLLDLTHAADFITVSYTYFHDHWKGSLIGHSDSNSAEDTGKLRVTYYNNYWKNVNSRGPSLRFGTGHIFNSVYDNVGDGINTRLGAQLLVENNVFSGVKKPLYSTDAGYAVARGNDFGGASNTALAGNLNSVPYGGYTLLAVSAVRGAVVGQAGATLKF